MSEKVRIIRFSEVDEYIERGARIVARFDCQVGPVRLYGCELLSTKDGRKVRTPPGVSVERYVMGGMRQAARAELAGVVSK